MNGQPRNEKSKFRHRGYVCKVCHSTTMIFGEDPEPKICENCGQIDQLSKSWDHVVTSTTVVEPHSDQSST